MSDVIVRLTSSSRDVVDVDVLRRPRAEHRFALVVVPERGDDVGDDEVRRVLGDQLEDEDAVLTQVHLRELVRYLAVFVVLRVDLPHYLTQAHRPTTTKSINQPANEAIRVGVSPPATE